jgi:hypothetical protein
MEKGPGVGKPTELARWIGQAQSSRLIRASARGFMAHIFIREPSCVGEMEQDCHRIWVDWPSIRQ